MAAVGVHGNEDFGSGDSPSPTDRARMLSGLGELLAKKGMAVPASCR